MVNQLSSVYPDSGTALHKCLIFPTISIPRYASTHTSITANNNSNDSDDNEFYKQVMSNLCTVNQADSAQLFPGAAGGLMVGFCLDPLYRCHLLHQSNLRLYSGQLICHCCYSRLISESHPSFTQLGILPPCLLYCYLHQLLCKMHYVKQIRNFKDFYCLKWITCILKHIFFFGRQ